MPKSIILYIDTADREEIKLAIETEAGEKLASQIPAQRAQAEKLLPAIAELLKKHQYALADIKEIKAAKSGDSFTSLRIGLATANALAYALNIPISAIDEAISPDQTVFGQAVAPEYNREPDISQKKTQ